MSSLPEVFICSTDAQELHQLLADPRHGEQADESALALSTKLFDAQIVGRNALPYGTVRLHCTVSYEELPQGTRRRVTLVNPREADAGAGRISVLSPIGRALLGHATGRVIDVALPSGRKASLRVVEVTDAELDCRDEKAVA